MAIVKIKTFFLFSLLFAQFFSAAMLKMKLRTAAITSSRRGSRIRQQSVLNILHSNVKEGLFKQWKDFSTVPHTGIEAQAAKKTAVRLGYFKDEFIQYFSKEESIFQFTPSDRRDYWLRVFTMRSVQKDFLAKAGDESDLTERQIINIGCGLDTAAFNFIKDKSMYTKFSYFEFDLSEIAERKANTIKETPEIRRLLPRARFDCPSGPLVDSDVYKLDSCDLYDLDSLDNKLRGMKVDFTKPTLVLTEFVLPYIESKQISSVIGYFSRRFQSLAMLDNSITNLGDEEGKNYIRYFQEWSIPLKGIDYFFTPQTISNENEKNGFDFDLKFWQEVFDKGIEKIERKRIEAIEKMDRSWAEIEMSEMKHYFISLAKKCANRD